ncbi:MAG: rhodanese-like domain-containing protein [Flavisolibacter sp.]
MGKFLILKSFILITIVCLSSSIQAQNPENWTKDQLMEPSTLANAIKSQKNVPVIISVGPGAIIPNSIDAGMASKKEGMEKLVSQLKKINKKKKVVIYCGCCPFDHCPNVRPAIDVLKKMKFKNYYLLDLPHNIKKDWLDEGYPQNR